jgi:hypothetical protein
MKGSPACARYISIDLETVGDNPADDTLVQAGFVCWERSSEAGLLGRTKLGSLSVNFVPGKPDPKQVEWWNSTPELAAIYASFAVDAKTPEQGMQEVRAWFAHMREGCNEVYTVSMPTIFDGTFMYSYWLKFLPGTNGARGTGLYSMIDVRSYAAGRLGCSYGEANKDKPALKPYMPDPELYPHTHVAVDDAEQQLMILFNLMDNVPQRLVVAARQPIKLDRRLTTGELRDTAQCRACYATWPRASLDWSFKQRVCIGTNDSWGNWKTYSNFIKCTECGELAVGDEEIITG